MTHQSVGCTGADELTWQEVQARAVFVVHLEAAGNGHADSGVYSAVSTAPRVHNTLSHVLSTCDNHINNPTLMPGNMDQTILAC